MKPEIEIWKTRSFWLAVATAAGLGARAIGIEFDEESFADIAFDLVPLVTLALAYQQRMRPKADVVVKRTKV